MFGSSNLQIYGLQPLDDYETKSEMKATINFLENLIRNELLSTNNSNNEINEVKDIKNKNDLIDIRKKFRQKINRNEIKEGKENNIENNKNSCKSEDDMKKKNNETIQKLMVDINKNNENESTNSSIYELFEGNSNEMTNNESNKTSLDIQKEKFMQIIINLDHQNQLLEKELAKEKRRRGDELSKIIKSLLCFEAKLKQDKKMINQKLYEKDKEIYKLLNLNKVLKIKFGANNLDDNSALKNETQFCLNCRKEFYGIEKRHIGTQTQNEKDKVDQTDHNTLKDEAVSISFSGTHHNKRTFESFKDYMRSRSMMVDDSNLDNLEGSTNTINTDENQYDYLKQNENEYSDDYFHHIVESFETDLNNKNSSKDDDKIILSKQSSEKTCSSKEFSETSPKHEFETSTDDWYASASDAEENDDVRVTPYTYDAVNPVLECVNQILLQQSVEESINDDPTSPECDDNDEIRDDCNKQNIIIRKRVHFSSENSMVHVPRDDISSLISDELEISNQRDNNFSYESIYSNEYEPIGSEHNSSNLYVDMESKLGQDDRIIIPDKPKPPELPPKPANLIKFRRILKIPSQPCLIQKIEEKTESEPDYCSISEVNEAITSVQIIADVHKPPEDDQNQNDIFLQKTDEIEEIFADIPKLPNVAAIMAPKTISKFINNDNYVTKSSPTKEENFNKTQINNFPKILEDINKKITTSTPTSIPSTSKSQLVSSFSPSKLNLTSASALLIPTTQSLPLSPTIISSPRKLITTTEDKSPLQAEFDWYNLDVEYGKSNQPDVIKATDMNTNTDKNHTELIENHILNEQISHGVEYNLDEEFSLTNQPDIIKENVKDGKICHTVSLPIASSSSSSLSLPSTITSLKPTICDRFPTIIDQTPCARRVRLHTDFTNFIENSGLSTKPLPRQRKIYFSGQFV